MNLKNNVIKNKLKKLKTFLPKKLEDELSALI